MRLAGQLAAGLSAVHQKELIHRDVKPENIWIEESGRVKLLDFGLALAEDQLVKTHSGALVGTPMYMSPEQACSRSVDHRTDLFSLGSVLYRAACGQPPFAGDSVPSLLMAVASCNPIPLSELRSDLPTELCDVIHRLLAADPDDRYATANALQTDLERLPERMKARDIKEEAPRESVAKVSPEALASGNNGGNRKRWWLLAAAALPLAILAAFLMRIEINGGTVEIVVDGADTPVQVNVLSDQSITITDPSDGESIKVTVDEDEQQMRIEKAGFATVTKAFDLSAKEGRSIRVRFIPQEMDVASASGNVSLAMEDRQRIIAGLLRRGCHILTANGIGFESESDGLPSPDDEIHWLKLNESASEEDLLFASKLPNLRLLSISDSKMTGRELAVLKGNMPSHRICTSLTCQTCKTKACRRSTSRNSIC